jgi:hypothetical protein
MEALNTLLKAFRAIIDLRHQMAMHIGTQSFEDGSRGVFSFEKVEHL